MLKHLVHWLRVKLIGKIRVEVTLQESIYGYDAIRACDDATRKERLDLLVLLFNKYACEAKDLDYYQLCLYQYIDKLKEIGHDLWRWDYSCDTEVWGCDYMRHGPGQGLIISSHYPDGIELEWEERAEPKPTTA